MKNYEKAYKEDDMGKYDVAFGLSETLMILEDLEDLIRPISAEAAEIIRRKSARLERRYKEIANGIIVDDQAG